MDLAIKLSGTLWTKTCFEIFSDNFTERELLPFLIKNENGHPKYPNLLQNNTDIFSQPNFLHAAITRSIPVNRHIDHNIDEDRYNQSMITKKQLFKLKTKKTYWFSTSNTNILFYLQSKYKQY